MEYKKGHKIKPDRTEPNGKVIFTDGTNDVLPNQISCEAYGYKWNRTNGTCTAFISNSKLMRKFRNLDNKNIGRKNITENNTTNTTIIGVNNTTKGQNKNVLISGKNHQVESGISDASVIGGTYGKAKNQGEVVIGGGKGLGLNQTSIVQFEGVTTDESATNLTVQGVSSSYITVQNNSIIGFEVKVAAISSGSEEEVAAGSYEYTELKGAVVIDNGYNTTFSQSSSVIARTASLGSVVMADVTDPYITVRVTGTAGVNIEWFASVQLTEKKLTTVTF